MNYFTCVSDLLPSVDLNQKKIVFTNGCFDVLHVGHVRYLKKTRELGDFLIIGLNSDDSVKRLKGESRPINSESDRAEVLLALDCVDAVVLFDEDTPLRLIKEINPDILTKGGDYEIDSIVGSEFLLKQGKEVIVIPFEEGYSSTKIIQQLNQ